MNSEITTRRTKVNLMFKSLSCGLFRLKKRILSNLKTLDESGKNSLRLTQDQDAMLESICQSKAFYHCSDIECITGEHYVKQ